jgi:uncharacterized alpha-E superfamily protein
VRILQGLGHFQTEPGEDEVEPDLLSFVYDAEQRDSLGWLIQQTRRNAWLLRDRISGDAWRIINELDRDFARPAPPESMRISAAQELLDRAVSALAAFGGLALEGMTRGHGWRFLDIGRRIEHATQAVNVLRSGLGFGPQFETGQLDLLLEVADSSITYRSRYLTLMQPDLVLDLLLLDEANPRSVAFQLSRLSKDVHLLPDSQSLIRRPAEVRIALSLLTAVQTVELAELVLPDDRGQWGGLEELLYQLSVGLRELSETLTRSYFSHAIPSRQLSAS